MTAAAALEMLFGAALVAIGVLAAALADRIRASRPRRARSIEDSRELVPVPSQPKIEVVEAESAPARLAPKKTSRDKAQTMADEVIAALIAAGYKKAVAAEAVWGCNAQDRETIERWTGAALRRCARGGMS